MSKRYILKKYNSSLSETDAVEDTTATTVGDRIRCVYIGSNIVYLVAYASESGPDGQVIPVAQVYSCNMTTQSTFTIKKYLPMWVEAGLPFKVDGAPRAASFAAVPLACKLQDVNGHDFVAGSVVITDISESTDVTEYSNPRRAQPVAVLDNYRAPMTSRSIEQQVSTNQDPGYIDETAYGACFHPYKPDVNSMNEVLCATVSVSENTNFAHNGFSLHYMKPSDRQVAMANDFISGSIVGTFDNKVFTEFGFFGTPNIMVEESGSGTLPAGTYNYVAYWEYVDALGRSHKSRTSRPATITTSGNDVVVTVTTPGISHKNEQITVNVYRTVSGGTQYYRLSRYVIDSDDTVSSVEDEIFREVVTDGRDDTELVELGPVMFRHPGTQGTGLDRYSALYSKHCIRHKDRIFYCRGNNIYFSSFSLPPEAPWFNPNFSFEVPGGSGKLTALASMEGVLVAFKEDSVFLVDGDGPPENGGSGAEFSPPRRLNTKFGCVDHRSLVQNELGLMYKSKRGLELLTRDFRFKYIGERVQDIVDTYPIVLDSTYDVKNSKAMWVLIDEYSDVEGMYYFPPYESQGLILVYDTVNDAWTTRTYERGSSSTWAPGVPMAHQYSNALGGKVFSSTTYSTVDYTGVLRIEDPTVGYDTDGNEPVSKRFVPWRITTGWIKSQSKQDNIRFSSLLFSGIKESDFNLKVENTYNYNRSGYVTVKTFTSTETDLTPVLLEIAPPKESLQSIKFRITSETPTSGTLGTGRQVVISGLTARVGLRGNRAQIASTAKG